MDDNLNSCSESNIQNASFAENSQSIVQLTTVDSVPSNLAGIDSEKKISQLG